MEKDLSSISDSLKKHEISLHGEMKYEHYFLSSQMTDLHQAYAVAKKVKSVVNVDDSALSDEISDLKGEKVHIKYMLSKLIAQLNLIEVEKKGISNEISIVYDKYESIRNAKWSLNEQISAIAKAKGLIVKEEVDVEAVISQLNVEVNKIYEKIEQMNKRQNWLVSWEDKLSADLSQFESEVKEFKQVEEDLAHREKYLKVEQQSLLSDAEAIELNMDKLNQHYQRIVAYLSEIEGYDNKIEKAQKYVSADEKVFSEAFSDFTCEEELLHKEACSSAKAPAKNNGVPGANGHGLPPAGHGAAAP